MPKNSFREVIVFKTFLKPALVPVTTVANFKLWRQASA